MTDGKDRFEFLSEESKAFAAQIKIDESFIIDIYHVESDWEFILKIDALLETATKEVIKRCLKGDPKLIDQSKVGVFVERLGLRGRTSLLMLLEATGCNAEFVELVDCVRRIRNGFAHDIRQIDRTLVEIVMERNDRLELIRVLSSVENPDENELIRMYDDDPKLLRFGIVDATLRFLYLSYNVVLKNN